MELETQNSEWLEAQANHKETVDKYFYLFEYVPISYMTPNNTPLLGEYTDQILEEARRATELTKNLLAFSRRQNLNLQTASVDEWIVNMIRFTRRMRR